MAELPITLDDGAGPVAQGASMTDSITQQAGPLDERDMALQMLVAAGFVTQQKVDEALTLAREILKTNATDVAAMAAASSGEAALAALPGDKRSELHAAIMNLPCQVPYLLGETVGGAFKRGHKEARHAAAELALFHSAGGLIQPVPQIAGRDGASAAPSDEGSA